MTLISLSGQKDIREPIVAPEGLYDVRCVKAALHQKEGSHKISLKLMMNIISDDPSVEYQMVTSYLGLPNDQDEADVRALKVRSIKRAARAFGVEFDGDELDIMEFYGTVAEGVRVKQEYNEVMERNDNKIVFPAFE